MPRAALTENDTRRYQVRQTYVKPSNYTLLGDALDRAELLWRINHRPVTVLADGHQLAVLAGLARTGEAANTAADINPKRVVIPAPTQFYRDALPPVAESNRRKRRRIRSWARKAGLRRQDLLSLGVY